MSAAKFEKLIDLIINEDQEQAEQLFHDIIVEKSREIYEGIINQDQSMGFQEEVEEEGLGMEGMMEEEEEFGAEEEFGDEPEFGDEEEGEFVGGDEEGEEDFGGEDELEDRVVDLEDKLDELMAEFEAQMGGDEEGADEFGGEEDFGGEEEAGEFDGEEEFGDEGAEDEVMESVQLKQVGGKTYDKFGKMGDNGAQTKSPTLQNPKRLETGGKPTDFSGSETVPTSAKKPSNIYSKGEKEEDFGNINKVGGNAGKTAFKTKAPAPKTETIKAKSPVAESKTAKRRI